MTIFLKNWIHDYLLIDYYSNSQHHHHLVHHQCLFTETGVDRITMNVDVSPINLHMQQLSHTMHSNVKKMIIKLQSNQHPGCHDGKQYVICSAIKNTNFCVVLF